MTSALFRVCLFFLILTQLCSNESSPSQLASSQPEPSALICGCVHAVTGDFLFDQPDIQVQGTQPIVIPRKYISSTSENPLEDQLLPHRQAFAWGIPDIVHITRVSIPEPNGMRFKYFQTQNRKYRPVAGPFQVGLTGYCTDYLGQKYHPANNVAYWPNDVTLFVKTTTGEVREYEKRKFANFPRECQFEFRLCRLHLSNGMLINYKYKKDTLKEIVASSSQSMEVLSKVELTPTKKQLLLEGSDHSKLAYTYKNYDRTVRGKKHKLKLLKYVEGTHYPSERLKREEQSPRIQERHFENGRTLICAYDEQGRVTELKGPQGLLATITYQSGATTSLDRDGNKTLYLYDPKTLRIEEIHYFQGQDHLIKKETYAWNSFGCLEQKIILNETGSPFFQIYCEYNEHLDLIQKKITGDQNYSIYYKYNKRSLPEEIIEENGRRTLYTFYKNTTLPEEISFYNGEQLLKKTRYVYNDNLFLVEEITEDGKWCFTKKIERKSTSPFYGMPESISEYCGENLIERTKFTYDKWGNVTKKERFGSDAQLATVTETIYNAKGQIEKEVDPEGNITEYHYDPNGNLISKITPLGLQILYEYDAANRQIKETHTAHDQTLTTLYDDFDSLDHPTKITDPLKGTTYRKYDPLGNLIEETNPLGHKTTYTYDVLGNRTSTTDPLGNTTTTTYNFLSQPLTILHPDRASAGKYCGGYHGFEDMSFEDIYTAHRQAGDNIFQTTENWMASSPYSSSDLYTFARNTTYVGIDVATSFIFPVPGGKTALSAGKALLRAEKIAHASPTLLKTSQVTGRVFKSCETSSHYRHTLKQLWTSTKNKTSVQNAYQHWKDHRQEFPEILNAKQYIEKAHDLFIDPLALKRIRSDGALIRYNPSTNTFGSYLSTGTPKTFLNLAYQNHYLQNMQPL
jgi:YD repeat-containing protein